MRRDGHHGHDGTDARDGEPKVQRAVQSVEVGGRLLLALAAHRGPMSLKDLAAAATLPAARAHPYLVSYGRLGLVAQDPASGLYALGPAALQLGLAALTQLDPLKAAAPVAEALARSSGHAVALAVWGNFGPTVVRMIDAVQPLHVSMRAGTVMSLLGTATGRAFAAVLPFETLRRSLARPLGEEDRPARPLLARGDATLREIVDEYRRHGVARAAGRPMPGVNAFSAVAFDHEHQPAIVVTALGHQDSFPSAWGAPMAEAVRDAAREVSRRLGGAPPA
ncbi:MAG: IclR family transcriptional regulator [Burkholderiales bacterium]|nr:MAG: IclR family transcriptional regulator [Burkholderiales bacterium]